MQHDAARTGKWGRKKHTRFHSTRALHSTLASKLSPQRRGCISLSLSVPKTRSFLCLEQGGSGSGVPNAYARTPSSNQQAIRHFAAWNAFSFRKPARTGRPLAPACTDTRDRAAVNGWRLIDSCAWEGEGSSSTLLCTIERMGRGGCVDGYCEVWLEFYRAPISSVLGFDAEFNILFVF